MVAIEVVMWRTSGDAVAVTGWGLLFGLIALAMLCAAISSDQTGGE